MHLTYNRLLSTDIIVSEIEALLDWRHHILRQSIFLGTTIKPGDVSAPDALLTWCRTEAEKGIIDKRIYEHFSLVHGELCTTARLVLEGMAGRVPLTLSLYDRFENQFEGYITQIRRLHQDVADMAVAVDPVTGLRTVAGMRGDLLREQNRFDRKGTAYSIAAMTIDQMAKLQQTLDRKGLDVVYTSIGQMIARMVRSFDDVYFLGKGEYVIVLKHVEFMDACAVMDRLRHDIETAQVYIPGNDKVKVTASFGVCEAQQRESPDIALEGAKAALREAIGQGGNRVEEFKEMSALEQYTKDITKK